MVDQNKQHSKSELTSGFNRTSIGTTPQDEKNVLLDALDGNSTYTPRADTYAKAEFVESNRKRKNQKKKASWQQLLLMIIQMQDCIETDFQEISDILYKVRKVCENTLDTIDRLNLRIDKMRRDHEFVLNELEQMKRLGIHNKVQDKHVRTLIGRYTNRTGYAVSNDDNLSAILLAQIAFEQSVKLPEYQDKIEKTGVLYEEGINAIEDISIQRDKLHQANQSLKYKPEDETILNELECLQKKTADLKILAKSKLNDLKYRLDQIEYENMDEPDNKSFDSQDKLQDKASLDFSSIGIKSIIPVPKGK